MSQSLKRRRGPLSVTISFSRVKFHYTDEAGKSAEDKFAKPGEDIAWKSDDGAWAVVFEKEDHPFVGSHHVTGKKGKPAVTRIKRRASGTYYYTVIVILPNGDIFSEDPRLIIRPD